MKKLSSNAKSDERWGYLFILPQFLGFLLFIIAPVLQSLYISFFEWDFITEPTFLGVKNYTKILSSPYTWKILGNTVYYIIGFVPLTIIFSIFLAFLMTQKLKGVSVYRTAIFLPNVTSSVADSLVWMWIFNPDMGFANAILSMIGINGPGWYASLEWAMPTVILMAVWQAAGYYMIVFMAGINGISETYYEAAKIDGANTFQCFTKITLPLLTPTIFFVLTMLLINGFQVFNEVYMLTRGGPADVTTTIVLEIYNNAFQFFKMGEAAVYSWILFIAILLVTALQFGMSKRWVNYDV